MKGMLASVDRFLVMVMFLVSLFIWRIHRAVWGVV